MESDAWDTGGPGGPEVTGRRGLRRLSATVIGHTRVCRAGWGTAGAAHADAYWICIRWARASASWSNSSVNAPEYQVTFIIRTQSYSRGRTT